MARTRLETKTSRDENAIATRPNRAARPKRQICPERAGFDGDETESSSHDSDEDYTELPQQRNTHQKRLRGNQRRTRTLLDSVEKSASCFPHMLCPPVAKRSKLFVMVQGAKFDDLSSLFIEWSSRYRQEREEVGLQLFNFILEAAGFPGDFIDFKDAEGKEPQVILDEALGTLDLQGYELNLKFPLNTNERPLALFPEHFRRFWILLAQVFEEELLTLSLYKDVASRILPLSSHMIRNLRHTGTVAGFAICEGVIDLYNTNCADRDRYKVQLSAGGESWSSADVRKTIEHKLRNSEKLIKRYEKCIQDLNVALSIRWRDRCPLIRKETFEALFRSIEKCPAFYLEDSKKCRCLGYALYDRDANIRISASEFLARIIYDDKIFDLLSKPTNTQPGSAGPSFLIGFLVRLVELPYDVELRVCLSGIKILLKLAENDFLSDEQIEQVVEYLWDVPSFLQLQHQKISPKSTQYQIYSEIRSGLAEFINTTTFANSVFHEWPAWLPDNRSTDTDAGNSAVDGQRDAKDLRAILEFILEFGGGYLILIDRFVSSFWNQTSSLRCVGTLLDFFIVGDSIYQGTVPLPDRYRFPLIVLTRSVYRHLELAAHVDSSTAVPCQTAAFWLEEATNAILTRIPSLTRVCKADSDIMPIAASIVSMATLNCEIIKSKIDIPQNIKVLSDIFLNCSFLSSFDYLGAAIFNLECLVENPPKSTRTMVNKVLKETQSAVINDDSEQQLAKLRVYLRRLLTIAKSANYNIFFDNWDIVDILLDICRARSTDSQPATVFITVIALQCLSLVALHLASDILEFEEDISFILESRNSKAPPIESTNEVSNKLTDRLSSPNKSVGSDLKESTNKSGRKRPRLSGPDPELTVSRKRRSQLRNCPIEEHCELRLKELTNNIDIRLERLISLWKSMGSNCLNLVKTDDSRIVQYAACTSLLESMRLLSPSSSVDVSNQLRKKARDQMKMTQGELAIVTKYLKLSIVDLEDILYSSDSNDIQLQFGTQQLDSFSLSLQSKSQVPLIDLIIDGELVAESDAEIIEARSSEFRKFILWRIVYLIRLFESIGSTEIFSSSITSLFLSLWWFNRPVLNFALSEYMKSLLVATSHDDHTNDVLWNLLESTTEIMMLDKNRRQRVKMTLQRVAKVLPSNFVFNHADQFLDLLLRVCRNKSLGKPVLPYFVCFVPSHESRTRFLEMLGNKISETVKSDSVRAVLTEWFFDKIKKTQKSNKELGGKQE